MEYAQSCADLLHASFYSVTLPILGLALLFYLAATCLFWPRKRYVTMIVTQTEAGVVRGCTFVDAAVGLAAGPEEPYGHE